MGPFADENGRANDGKLKIRKGRIRTKESPGDPEEKGAIYILLRKARSLAPWVQRIKSPKASKRVQN